jgi:ATP-dependent DNA ligase
MLQRRSGITVTYMAFDVLARDGESITGEPYGERRRQLEEVDFDGRQVRIVPTFEDGETLFAEVCEYGSKGWSRSATVTGTAPASGCG